MYKRNIIALLVLAICFTDSSIHAQPQNVRFNRLSIEDGLSNSYVTCIIQDSKGFMWIGTQDGLNKYDGYKFTVYKYDPSNSNSLSDNYIRSIIETEDGFLWIGTENGGLNKFDPATETFIHYKHEMGNSNSLCHNTVLVIYEEITESGSVLWIGTGGGGLDKFDPVSNTFTHYTHESENINSLSNNTVRAILKDRSGAFWIGTDDGLNMYSPESENWTHYFHDSADVKSVTHSRVLSLYEDKNGILWFGTFNHLNQFVPSPDSIQQRIEFDARRGNGTFIRYTGGDYPLLKGHTIMSLHEDQFGMLWIGTYRGVNRLNKAEKTFVSYSYHSGNPNSIAGNMITTIFEDRSGLLWFGTGGSGISILNPVAENFIHFPHIPGDTNSLSDPSIRGIFEDQEGILWVGGYSGLNKIDRNTGQITHYRQSQDIKSYPLFSNLIYTIIGDPNDDNILWLGTEGTGLYNFNKYTEKTKRYVFQPEEPDPYAIHILSNDFIYDMYADTRGLLWIATDNGLNQLNKATGEITVYKNNPDNAHSLSGNKTRAIFEDSAEMLWIGTETDGLNHYNRKTERFTRFLHDPDNPESVSNNRIKTIYEDQKERLWIGTNGGGLNLFNRKTETFKRYTEKDGLPNDVIYGILEDKNGHLWLSTNWGLSRFNPETEEFRNYDVNDGLQSNEFNTASYFKSESGEMFFGGINGFNAFYPDKIREFPYAPPIVITDFQIFNKSVPIGETEDGRSILLKHISETEEINLSYKDNVISFEFTALSFAAPKNNQYAYIMEGVDKDWIFTDASRRFANYIHLDPGKYIFRVKGSNHDGVWNEEDTSISISLTPPPWKTWWAYTIYLIGVFGSIVGVIEWRLIQTRIRTRRLEYMVNERTAEVEQQKKEIEVQAEKLVELDKMKSRFFANISHEFRTPLTLIRGPLESFRAQKYGPISKTADRHLDISLNNVDRLQKLINELLELSKLEAGKLKLETTLGDINGFLRRVVDSFYSAAEKKGINLNLILDNDRIDVYFDENKLERVINNLLSNALKFTPANGEVAVTAIDAAPIVEQGTGTFVTIKITDTGIGIPPKALPHVFERFFQVEGSKKRKFEGTGIGLALAKELVELHGGESTVESEIGVGTTFVISLPKGRAHLSDEEVVIKTQSIEYRTDLTSDAITVPIDNDLEVSTDIPQPVSAPKVLIVEDNAELREYIKDHLAPAFIIIEATNGKEGLEKTLEIQPSLIISDIMMPEMDGIEMTGELKQNETTNAIPIILLTARADVEDRLAGLETRADDYITKPFNMDELKLKISNLIEGRQHLKEKFSRRVMIVEPEKMNLDSADKTFMEQALAAVEAHLSDQDFNVETLAKLVFLSKRQFDRKIQLLTGLPPATFIRQIRLKRAKQYSEEQAYSTVAEVANLVGFNNVKYFSRLYKQAFGQFPSELIKKSGEW